MNKNDLMAAVSGSTGLSKADCARAVDSVFDSIADALKAGQEVRIVAVRMIERVMQAAAFLAAGRARHHQAGDGGQVAKLEERGREQ